MPALTRRFDYTTSDPGVQVGTRVRVVLNGRRVGAWVQADDVEPPVGLSLAPLSKVSGFGPPAPVVELAEWAAWRWAGPISALLTTASPKRVVASLPEAPVWPSTVVVTDRAAGDRIGAPGIVAEARARLEIPSLVRLPPAEDPFALVEAVLEAVLPAQVGTVLVLVPNLGWSARLVSRLARRGVAVTDQWAPARAGWPVVVGVRAAAWAPLPRLGAAVVLDAHDEAYREERAPTFNAWEVVAERAAREGAPCLLVSACPTAVQVARTRPVSVGRPLERAGWPVLSVVDRRGADPRTGLLSNELVDLARRVQDAPEPLVCVLNRTGRAKLLACAHCGELARCEHCGSPLEQVDQALRCRRCGAERPAVCAVCGATRLKVLRPGVARLREELEALLGRAVTEVAGPKGGAGEAPLDVKARVLIGTEAVLHRVRRASAVAFLDFDQHLLAPRFSAGEEALGLLARAGRLVGGRAQGPRHGQVLVQTRLPDHEVLMAAVRGDPGLLSGPELVVRRALDLPPYSALALVSGASAGAFVADLEALGQPGVTISDVGDGRWLVRARQHSVLADALGAPVRPRGRLRVEVDPTSV